MEVDWSFSDQNHDDGLLSCAHGCGAHASDEDDPGYVVPLLLMTLAFLVMAVAYLIWQMRQLTGVIPQIETEPEEAPVRRQRHETSSSASASVRTARPSESEMEIDEDMFIVDGMEVKYTR